ncbi:hypothetical protein MMC32_008359 [Xylographa parallela]|nr:hypothetical protein [Xylographa parallela]
MTSPSPTPLLLLKTRNTPTDAYATYFSLPPPPTSTAIHLQPTFLPVLQYTFHETSLSHLRALLSLPAPSFPYGGLICTSQRAVEALGQVLDELSATANGHRPLNNEGGDNQAECPQSTTAPQNGQTATPPAPPAAPHHALAIPLYTVGPATARALFALQQRHLPRCSVHGHDTGDGAKLAAYILAHYSSPTSNNDTPPSTEDSALPLTTNAVPPSAARAPLLFLVGEQRRAIIPTSLASSALATAQRIRVDELVVYATQVEAGFAQALERALREGRVGPVWVAVFSPTGCAEMVKALRGRGVEGSGEGLGLGREVCVASIGPTTRDYLRVEFGFEVDVCAERPSPEGLAEGIGRFMREKGGGREGG